MVADSYSRGAAANTGDIVEGRYRIIKTLGVGSMGSVYLAEHVLIKRRVAIKILRSELAEDADVLDGFMNEARAAGTLGHPNIVECTDMGLTRNSVPYLVLEYLEGALLTDEIYRVGGLPIRRALKIADQIASALLAAHNAGVVHRDLKSDNVFLTDKQDTLDVVKVLDFGIARLMGGGRSHQTRRGLVMGTPEFMAPEQVTNPDAVDHRADIYALGVILYEMLTARRPFSGDDKRALLHRVVYEPPPPLMRPEAPPGFEEMLVGKLLAKDPAERYGSMRQVQSALEAFATVSRSSGQVSTPIEVVRALEDAPPSVESMPQPAEAVALPALRRRRTSRLPWLVASGLLAGVGGGIAYLESQLDAAHAQSSAAALDGDAEKLASLIDGEVRAAHLRAEGVAAMPMLRAAVETDAATLKDMVGSDFIFSPKPGEVLELFQLRGGAPPASMVRIPDSAAPVPPIAANQTRIASDGSTIRIVVGAPVMKQQTGVGGAVAIAMPIDLAPIRKRIAEHAQSAVLLGLGPPVSLVADATHAVPIGREVTVPVPLGPDLASGEASLTAMFATPETDGGGKFRIARIACLTLAGALFVLYLASLLRGR